MWDFGRRWFPLPSLRQSRGSELRATFPTHSTRSYGILRHRIQIQVVPFIRKRGPLHISTVGAIHRVDEVPLPRRSPIRSTRILNRIDRRERTPLTVDVHRAAADEIVAGMIEVVVRPVIAADAL